MPSTYQRVSGQNRLAGTAVENIDIKNLVLADFDLRPMEKADADDTPAELRPMTASSKTAVSKKDSLRPLSQKSMKFGETMLLPLPEREPSMQLRIMLLQMM